LIITDRLSASVAPLVIEQPLLAPQAAAVTAQRAVSANDAVARNDDANHVRAIRATNRPAGVFVAKPFRHPGIRPRLADRDRPQDFPRAQLKRRADGRQRDIELQLSAGEIIAELLASGCEMPMLAGHNIRP